MNRSVFAVCSALCLTPRPSDSINQSPVRVGTNRSCTCHFVPLASRRTNNTSCCEPDGCPACPGRLRADVSLRFRIQLGGFNNSWSNGFNSQLDRAASCRCSKTFALFEGTSDYRTGRVLYPSRHHTRRTHRRTVAQRNHLNSSWRNDFRRLDERRSPVRGTLSSGTPAGCSAPRCPSRCRPRSFPRSIRCLRSGLSHSQA